MDQAELLRYLVETLETLGIRYMIGGAQAAMFYGEPQFTRDIDGVAEIEPSHIPGLLDRFPGGDFYVSEEAVRGAIRDRGRFNIIHPASGLKIDVILPKGTEYDRMQFSRRERHEMLEGLRAYFARPEDVILYKMIYSVQDDLLPRGRIRPPRAGHFGNPQGVGPGARFGLHRRLGWAARAEPHLGCGAQAGTCE